MPNVALTLLGIIAALTFLAGPALAGEDTTTSAPPPTTQPPATTTTTTTTAPPETTTTAPPETTTTAPPATTAATTTTAATAATTTTTIDTTTTTDPDDGDEDTGGDTGLWVAFAALLLVAVGGTVALVAYLRRGEGPEGPEPIDLGPDDRQPPGAPTDMAPEDDATRVEPNG